MNGALEAMGIWLADFQLLALALLGAVAVALAATRQPARRLAVVRSLLAGLAVLAVLCALPGWSLVHLVAADRDSVAAPAIVNQSSVTPAGATPVAHGDNAEQIQGQTSIDVVGAKPQATVERTAGQINWRRATLVAYSGGSLAVVIWLACGSVLAGRVRRSAEPAPEALRGLLQRIVGAGRAPALSVSDRVGTAVALGIWRPTIILSQSLLNEQIAGEPRSPSPRPRGGPASQNEDGGEMAAVLAHEWAHIRHGDLWMLAASRFLLVLVWPQPLYWLVRRWMRLDQETLADAAAVAVTERVDYAQQLLGWAQRAAAAGAQGRAPRLAGAVGLWEGPSELKLRVAALLDEKFNLLRECSRQWHVGSACLLLIGAGGLSLVTFQRSERRATAAAPEANDASTAAASATPARAATGLSKKTMQRIKEAYGKLKQRPNAVVGVCLDHEGEPLAGVEVTLYRLTLGANRRSAEEVSTQKTDANGQFGFEDVIDAAKEFPDGQLDDEFQSGVGMRGVLARAPGQALEGEVVFAATLFKQGSICMMRFEPAATLRGQVTGPDGKPVPGALVSVDYELMSGLSLNTARTDAEGRYAIENLKSWDAEAQKKWFNEELERRRKAGTNGSFLATSASGGAPTRLLTVRHPDFAVKLVEVAKIPGESDVQLAPAAVLEGRVLFAENGKSRPAADVAIRVMRDAPVRTAADMATYTLMQQESSRTDADGRYRFASLPPGKYTVTAQTKDWVTNGLTGVETVRSEIAQAPEMLLTRGALVRLQLIDASSGQPLVLKDGQRAYVNPFRLPPVSFGLPVLADNVVKFNASGESKVRVPPGRYEFLITMPETDWQHPFWQSANADKLPESKGVELREGERASVTVAMRKQEPRQATATFVAGGRPPADSDAKADKTDKSDGKADERLGIADPSANAKTKPERFVRIVVGPGGELTYQGEKTTWDALPAILEKAPHRDKTVLEIAIASDEMSVRESNDAQALGFGLADRFKFLYGSFVGVHPLGSTGTTAETSIAGSLPAGRFVPARPPADVDAPSPEEPRSN